MTTTMRVGTFETNSSSVHSVMLISPQEYHQWESGELLYDYWNSTFVTAEEAERMQFDPDYIDGGYLLTLDDFVMCKKALSYLESEVYPTRTPGGEEVYIASYYGRD